MFAMSVRVRGYFRQGRWVRPHSRRAPMVAVGAVLVVAVVLVWWVQGAVVPWSSPADSVTVVWVVDGDTIDVTGADGAKVRVRVLGIDTPELARHGKRADCYAVKAKTRLGELVRSGAVTLTDDPSQPAKDRYLRRLAYVEVDGDDVGAVLVREGFAREYHPKGQPAPARSQAYAAAEEAARAGGVGLWGRCA